MISIWWPWYYAHKNSARKTIPDGVYNDTPPTLSYKELVIQGTSLTYDGIPVNESLIYFKVGKRPSEKNRFKVWQPHTRGIFIKANTSADWQTLNKAGVTFFSQTSSGRQQWFTKELIHDPGATRRSFAYMLPLATRFLG